MYSEDACVIRADLEIRSRIRSIHITMNDLSHASASIVGALFERSRFPRLLVFRDPVARPRALAG